MSLILVMFRLTAPFLWSAGVLLLSSRAAGAPYSGLVVELETDRALYERNADELRHPASLTKMMTLYLVFEALAGGELFPNTAFQASRFAVLRPPSRLGLSAGDRLTVEDGILALVTRSANDAASVIAENMAGSESAFAALMTEKARQLGMSQTVFRNASGLPDPNQVTTAWDMYRLGKALNQDFPQYYPYFSTPKFYYDGQGFQNHNHLMESYPGMDGIKTGYVNASGFNLVASAKRGGRRLIGVVFGGPSATRRDAHMREILDDGFAQLEGALPRVITAEFDRSEPPNLLVRPQLAERSEVDLPSPASLARAVKAAYYPQLQARKAGGQTRILRVSSVGRGKSTPRLQHGGRRISKQRHSPLSVTVSASHGPKKNIYLAHRKGSDRKVARTPCSSSKRKSSKCASAR